MRLLLKNLSLPPDLKNNYLSGNICVSCGGTFARGRMMKHERDRNDEVLCLPDIRDHEVERDYGPKYTISIHVTNEDGNRTPQPEAIIAQGHCFTAFIL